MKGKGNLWTKFVSIFKKNSLREGEELILIRAAIQSKGLILCPRLIFLLKSCPTAISGRKRKLMDKICAHNFFPPIVPKLATAPWS